MVEYVKPANQVQLSANELNEEFARSLNAARPGPAKIVMRFNLEEKAFKVEPQLEQVSVHYSAEGCLVWRESEEGQRVTKLHAAADEAQASRLQKVQSLPQLLFSSDALCTSFCGKCSDELAFWPRTIHCRS